MTDEKLKKETLAPSVIRGEKRRRDKREKIFLNIIYSIASVLGGFLFAGTKLPFDTYPLGLCLVCSSEKYALQSFSGVLIYLFVNRSNASLYLPTVLAAISLGLRYLFAFLMSRNAEKKTGSILPENIFFIRDDISVRVLLSSFAYLISAISRIISGGTFYELFAGVFGTLAAALFTFLFSFAFDKRYKEQSAGEAGRAALVFCAVMSLSGVEFFTISVSLVMAYIITLYSGYSGEGSRGAVTGLLVGLAAGGDFAVIFAFAGLAAGVFYELSPLISGLVSVGITVLGGIYTLDTDHLVDFLPEIIIAAVIVTTAAIFDLLPLSYSRRENRDEKGNIREILMKKREEEREISTGLRANMLSSLSLAIRSLSEKFRKPDKDRLSSMCKEVISGFCAECPKKAECKKLGGESDMVVNITEKLMAGGKIDDKKSVFLTGRGCEKTDLIISAINSRATKMFEETARADKTKIFAFDYEAAAKIISDAVGGGASGYKIDKALTEKLSRAFEKSRIFAENVVVCGDRKKYIIATGRELLKTDIGAKDIKRLCENICGGGFTAPEYTIESGNAAMTLESMRAFEVEYAGRQSAKKGERVCGDAIGVTESRDDFFYGFICDGMGSGEEADLTAGICKTFLLQMLSSGNKKTTTLEMINMFVGNKNTECFSTIDLLEIDLMRGTASFTKSGAAASYIVRHGAVYKIASGTMPIGILPEVSAEVTEISLCDGDVIVMCSDGVCHDPELGEDENSMHIIDFLENERMTDMGKLAENIISDAALYNKRTDDMSVGVFRIKKSGAAAIVPDGGDMEMNKHAG